MDEIGEVVDVTERDDTIAGETEAPEAEDELGRLERVIESVLFAAAAPVSLRRLVEILAGPTSKEVQSAVTRLRAHYAPGQRGIQLHDVAGGYQFRTARENAEWVRAVFRDKPARLGRAALETLAIVAYKQPVTRGEIEAIRGVDVDGVLTTLLARRLITISGRKEAVGRPLLYSTAPEFLEAFGLKDLNELPSLKELGPVPDAEDGETTAPTESHACAPAASSESERLAADDAARASLDPEAAAAAGPQDVAEAGPHDLATAADPTTDGAPAEAPQPRGDCLTAQSGGTDRGGPGAGEWTGGDPARDESEPEDGSHHD